MTCTPIKVLHVYRYIVQYIVHIHVHDIHVSNGVNLICVLTPPGVDVLVKRGGVEGGASSPEGLRRPVKGVKVVREAGGGRSEGVGGAG